MKATSENQVQELKHLIARVEDVASVRQQQQQAPARDAAPAVEVGKISQGQTDGILNYTLPLNFVPVTGRDELTIVVK